MRLWVTRPATDAEVLQADLLVQGHEVVIEPLLSVDLRDSGIFNIADIQALIVTSRNGLRAIVSLPQANSLMELPLFTVGAGTATTARAYGFQKVFEGPSSAEKLLAVIQANTLSDRGGLLYFTAETKAVDLGYHLRQSGYHVREYVVYVTRPINYLSSTLISQIVVGTIQGVILLSPRTAQIYVDLIEKYQLALYAQRMVHFCLSQAVSNKLLALRPREILISERPNIYDLLRLTEIALVKSTDN